LSRQRKIQFSRSKAILVAAGALSIATAASVTATTTTTTTTWTSGSVVPVRLSGHAAATGLIVRRPPGVNGVLRLAVADQPTPPQADAAYQLTDVTFAARASQIRAAATQHAVAQRTAAQKRAAKKAAAARAAAAATPLARSGSPQQIAEAMLGSFGWSSGQFACLDPLWAEESGWSATAENPSGAYGIPQALPGAKMASAGPDWQTNAATQIEWGLEYIKGTYGSPCAALGHEQATGWY
jgi:hypothetical protein